MRKRAALVLTLLLLAACSIYVSSPDITMVPGETTTVTIEEHRYFSGTVTNLGTPLVSSSNPAVVAVTQGTPVVLQALQPGEAQVVSPIANYGLVKVHVLACLPVAIHPLTASTIGTKVGSSVHLQVQTEGTLDLGTNWLEEKNGGWSLIPFASNSKSYDFTPRTSGTYRFEVNYHDRCGSATTVFTVVASTRTHAVRP